MADENTVITKQTVILAGSTQTLSGGTYTVTEQQEDYTTYGAIVNYGNVTITGTSENKVVFTGNTFTGGTAFYGAGIYNNASGCKLNVSNAVFSNNYAANAVGYGGAIYCKDYVSATMDSVTFKQNYSGNDGGAIYCGNRSALTISNSEFISNRASMLKSSRTGGAIIVDGYSSLILNNVSFVGNRASQGGAIRLASSTLNLRNVTFNGNVASASSCGAIYSSGASTVNLTGWVKLLGSSDMVSLGNSKTDSLKWYLTVGAAGNTDFSLDWSKVYRSDSNLLSCSVILNAISKQYLATYTLARSVNDGRDFAVTLTINKVAGETLTVNSTTTVDTYWVASEGTLYELKLNGDQTVTLDISRAVFYDGSWVTGGTATGTYRGQTFSGTVGDGVFYNDAAAASAAAKSRGALVAFSGVTATKSVQYGGVNTRVESGTYGSMFFGGTVSKTAGIVSGSSADYTISIGSGTFSKSIAGGDVAASGSQVDQDGNINLVIEGGTFFQRVAGGMYVADKNEATYVTLNGNVNLTITGGTFTGRIYGGNNAMNDDIGERATLNGSVNVLVDCKNAIYIGENLVAGSRGAGSITGSTTVTFSGSGSNLNFAGGTTSSCVVFGGCNADVMKKQVTGGTTTYTPISKVTGSRNLVFNAFTGDFDAKVRLFSTISFENVSTVNFKNTKLDLWGVSEWNFEYGSSLTGLTANEFAQDTLNFDLTGYLSGNWTVATGSVDAMADLGSAAAVNFGTSAATWNESGKYWADGNYKLRVTTSGNTSSLIVSKLA